MLVAVADTGAGLSGKAPGKPDFDNPKVAVNSRLFEDFDFDAVPVTVIDAKNLW
jgi:hypothetical protein